MIQAVVFDLGKVLVDFDYGIAIRRLAARSRMTALEIADLVSHSTLLLRYECGILTNEEFFSEVQAATGYSGTIQEFAASFGDIFTPIEPMIQLQRALHRQGLPTYIFSNTNDFAVHHIRNSYPFFAEFDGYILSYQHGAMKPDANLYEAVERESGCKGAELLYFDDRQENVAVGRARGWQVVLQETPEKTLTAVRRLGLL